MPQPLRKSEPRIDPAKAAIVRRWPGLSFGAKLLWQLLWEAAEFRPRSFTVSAPGLADALGMANTHSITNWMRSLEAAGLVEVDHRREGRGARIDLCLVDPQEAARGRIVKPSPQQVFGFVIEADEERYSVPQPTPKLEKNVQRFPVSPQNAPSIGSKLEKKCAQISSFAGGMSASEIEESRRENKKIREELQRTKELACQTRTETRATERGLARNVQNGSTVLTVPGINSFSPFHRSTVPEPLPPATGAAAALRAACNRLERPDERPEERPANGEKDLGENGNGGNGQANGSLEEVAARIVRKLGDDPRRQECRAYDLAGFLSDGLISEDRLWGAVDDASRATRPWQFLAGVYRKILAELGLPPNAYQDRHVRARLARHGIAWRDRWTHQARASPRPR